MTLDQHQNHMIDLAAMSLVVADELDGPVRVRPARNRVA